MAMNTHTLTRISDPAVEPVSPSEVKIFLRITQNEEDTLITTLIAAARERIEQYLRRSIITQTWLMSFNQAMGARVLLPMSPVQSISGIKTIARDGTENNISASTYYLSAGNRELLLDTALVGHRVEVRYIAGYGDTADDVPQAIRYAIMATVGFMYDFRGADGLPQEASNMLFPYRIEGC